MNSKCAFTIYNASAGSGKTYTLVKEYLKILLRARSPIAFRSILSLTFTNKAVSEMKERIVKTLQAFSDEKIITKNDPMFVGLCETLGMEPVQLHEKSKKVLEAIVHNYAAFDIATIDKFNHQLIRTFAHDLKLPVNFEVTLNTKDLLDRAVENLIEKVGSDDVLTNFMVDFAISKADEDKSWDVSRDLKNISELLTKENDIPYINDLKDKTLADFKQLKDTLAKTISRSEAKIISEANSAMELIGSNGLENSDFIRKTLPNHFIKASKLDFTRLYDNNLQTNLEERSNIYKIKTDPAKAVIIDRILPTLEAHYLDIKKTVHKCLMLRNAHLNITPLSVLNAINNSLKDIKEDEGLLMITEFNSIIGNEIKDQPAPYIYERIGEKFRHFFIDEFQDTSQLQWDNLTPMVFNAISSENMRGERGTAMIVGDAKQSIYRWRGGKAELFMDLCSKQSKVFSDVCVENLPDNYRSAKQIVELNNSFFKYLSEFVFSDEKHKAIYQNCSQNYTIEEGGYVEFCFLDTKNLAEDESKDLINCTRVHETIEKAKSNGFDYGDMCIITRERKEGSAIAEYLSNENILVISSDSLLIKNAPETTFVIAMFGLALQPKNDSLKFEALSYLANNKLHLDDHHAFYSPLIHLEASEMFRNLPQFDFDFNAFVQTPLYDAAEMLVRDFGLNTTPNAHLQYLMDEILDFSIQNRSGFSGFVSHWEQKKEQLSIVSPQGTNAIQIMTIHKSKGLEFPVVIFPYANRPIRQDKSQKAWFPVEQEQFNGFSHLFINMNADVGKEGEVGALMYKNHRSELELDNINLLYVVMTRASEQLYIISELDLDNTGNERESNYSGLFIKYLKELRLWEKTQNVYTFGNPSRRAGTKKEKSDIIQAGFISTKKEDHNIKLMALSGILWETSQKEAQEKGNLLHLVMSKIQTNEDIVPVLSAMLRSGEVTAEQFQYLTEATSRIVNHHKLSPYYTANNNWSIHNERDIISGNGTIHRPDRIMFNNRREAILLDYKTGAEKSLHAEQLTIYKSLLEDMGFSVIKQILVYINDGITIKEF